MSMTHKEIQKTLVAINSDIEKKQLKDAFDKIRIFLKDQKNWALSEELTELENNYRYMIHYFIKGNKDPQQRNIYNQLLRRTYTLAQDAAENLCLQSSTTLFFEKTRLILLRGIVSMDEYREIIGKQMDTFAFIDLLEDNDEKEVRLKLNIQAHEQTVEDLFYSVFASPRANDDMIASYHRFMEDEIIPVNDKCMVVSALTLNILQRFDVKKIEFLLDLCKYETLEIAIRAIVGIIPIFQIYESRWELYPECTDRLKLLSDDPAFTRRMIYAILRFIQAQETEKITKKLTEEILPQMMKLTPIIGKKINLDEWMGESGMEDKNPEWQKILDDVGLTDKLQEFSDMQLEGADVFHFTFSSLKSYPFFYEMSNWFLPFDPRHSQLQRLFSDKEEGKSLFEAITESPHICNSDKYSFCFSIMIMPERYRKMMISQLAAEGEEIKKMQEEEFLLKPYQEEETICRQYIQDLYRFFKVFPRRGDFIDIFALPLNYHRIKPFHPITLVPEHLDRIALYYFENNHFEEALDSYTILSKIGKPNGEVWQKMGYCHQMLGNIREALNAYLHAELIDENNTWVLRRIAQCYRLLKKPADALAYYRRLEQLKPDDLNIQLNIGHCYLELKDYDTALNYYFKVELLDSGNTRAWRSIAWCAFLLKKFDIAQKYYAQILSDKPNAHDYLNAGHVELCIGNMEKAVQLYEESLKMAGNFSTFRTMLKEDENELQEAGVNTEILPLLLDKIKYDMEEKHQKGIDTREKNGRTFSV
jgi:tetratricopeptide (TPR) repeat protein